MKLWINEPWPVGLWDTVIVNGINKTKHGEQNTISPAEESSKAKHNRASFLNTAITFPDTPECVWKSWILVAELYRRVAKHSTLHICLCTEAPLLTGNGPRAQICLVIWKLHSQHLLSSHLSTFHTSTSCLFIDHHTRDSCMALWEVLY